MNWRQLCDKWINDGYESLSEPEEVWLNTRSLIDSVNNGGLVSFFYNSNAELYDETVYALGEIGGFEVQELLESYGKQFGEEVPYDIDERNEIINSWKDDGPAAQVREKIEKEILAMMDPLDEQLTSYLKQHNFDPD